MQRLRTNAPWLGGLALGAAAGCFAWGSVSGAAGPVDASVVFAALALALGLLAPGRRATLALVVPSLVYLVVMLAPG